MIGARRRRTAGPDATSVMRCAISALRRFVVSYAGSVPFAAPASPFGESGHPERADAVRHGPRPVRQPYSPNAGRIAAGAFRRRVFGGRCGSGGSGAPPGMRCPDGRVPAASDGSLRFRAFPVPQAALRAVPDAPYGGAVRGISTALSVRRRARRAKGYWGIPSGQGAAGDLPDRKSGFGQTPPPVPPDGRPAPTLRSARPEVGTDGYDPGRDFGHGTGPGRPAGTARPVGLRRTCRLRSRAKPPGNAHARRTCGLPPNGPAPSSASPCPTPPEPLETAPANPDGARERQ